MKSFGQFITESSVHYFDVDKTLMDTGDTHVHVKDEHGNTVEKLDPQQYNHHKLQPGHSYDFHEFASSEKFAKSAKPIRKVLAKMKGIVKNGGKAGIITARGDFDDKDKFARKWGSYGVNIGAGGVHVHRAGNIKLPTHEAKAKIISDQISKNGYKKVHLYDDHLPNIQSMLDLKKKHPDVEFHGYHVQHGPDGVTMDHYKA